MAPIILCGFDSIEARHAAQDLWPDLIIDGAIGGMLECQVSCHPWGQDVACLRCLFENREGERAEVVQQRLTGLAASALDNLLAPLNEAHLIDATPESQEWLRQRIGKPICSILEEAYGLSDEKQRSGFRPSVPFVATMSACMMITELVRYLTERRTEVSPRFQFSLLWGPARGELYPESRHANCLCTTRSKNIEHARLDRANQIE